MSESVSPKIREEQQKLSTDNLVTLYILDLTSLNGGIVYFTDNTEGDTTVKYDGQEYTPIEITAKGFEWNGKGKLPTPTLTVTNVGGLVTSLIVQYGDLLGTTLIRVRTFRRFLDTGSDPDGTARFSNDVFKIEQKSKHNRVMVEWTLSAVLDQEGRKIPHRQILRDACTHFYRMYNPLTSQFDSTLTTCPFQGNKYYDEANQPTTIDKDKCAKTLAACKLRFGEGAVLPTRAFPGVTRSR